MAGLNESGTERRSIGPGNGAGNGCGVGAGRGGNGKSESSKSAYSHGASSRFGGTGWPCRLTDAACGIRIGSCGIRPPPAASVKAAGVGTPIGQWPMLSRRSFRVAGGALIEFEHSLRHAYERS